MVKDVRAALTLVPKASSGAEGRSGTALGNEEDAALVARQSSPLAGLEFRQSLPAIKDSDLGFDRHLRGFRALLVVFQRTLVPGGVRLKISDNEAARAVKAQRLLAQKQAVYDELLETMNVLRESK